jgi:hypothetical protein
MTDPKDRPKKPGARETSGEGAPKRTRTEGGPSAEEKANPRRGGSEEDDARLIDRNRDARNPRGL